jgi:hypothetical protein
MAKLQIKFKDNEMFPIQQIHMTFNDSDPSRKAVLTLRAPLKDDMSGLWDKLVPENLDKFSIVEDGQIIDEYTGFVVVEYKDKIIDENNKILNARLRNK